MKINAILNSQEALNELLDAKLKASVAFKIKRVAKIVTSIMEDFESAKKGLFDKYGETTEVEGQETMQILPENLEVFKTEFDELMDQDIDQSIVKISPEEFDNVEISARTLLQVDWLFDEESKG